MGITVTDKAGQVIMLPASRVKRASWTPTVVEERRNHKK
jgi:hypothetical protein